MNKNIPLTLKSCLISLVLLSIVGCGTSADSSNNQSEINQQKQTPSSSNQHKKHAAKDQTGKFIAIYQPARNAQTKIEEKFWRSNYLLAYPEIDNPCDVLEMMQVFFALIFLSPLI